MTSGRDTRVSSQRAGRKNNNVRIRELVSVMGSLTRAGDVITIPALATRLGIGEDEAHALMDVVCQASGENSGGLLISANDDETEYTLQYQGVHGMPLRLTEGETLALLHALDVAGFLANDPVRKRLQASLTSREILDDEVRRALGSAGRAKAETQKELYACAQSIVTGRALEFLYQGLRDDEPRERHVLARSLSATDDVWYVCAHDLDLKQERTFRIDRMKDVRLGCVVVADKTDESEVGADARRVRITFYDPVYYIAFSWPHIRVLERTDDCIMCDIPYYGEKSDWLIRRICAGGGSIIVDDDRIMQLAREYARKLLG